MGSIRRASLADQIAGGVRHAHDLSTLAEAVCAAVSRRIPFAFGCFATLDPASGLVTWAHKTGPLGVGDEEFAALEYGDSDVNTFAEISQRNPPVGILSVDTAGRLDNCRRYREFLSPRFGFRDELRVTFNGRATTWGALAVYRTDGSPPFTASEGDELAACSGLVAVAIQQALFGEHSGPTSPESRPDRPGSFRPAAPHPPGPAVLIIDAKNRVTQLSAGVPAAVDDLGGWDHGSLPTNVLAVVASARRANDSAAAKVPGRAGGWVTVAAVRLDGSPGSADVVVTIEAATGSEISRLALAARGLSAREEDVAMLVLQGASTKAISSSLHLSPHTVQDHLKSVFVKLGVNSRREMIAKLLTP